MSEEQQPPTLSLEEAQGEIERLKKENQEYLEGWKRAKADYLNFKQDQEKRGKELAQFAGISIIMQLVPVYEYFRKALNEVPPELQNSEWLKGVSQIYKQMKEVLKAMGCEEYRVTRGDVFDPTLHDAVGQEYSEGIDDDSVSQEVSAGYALHGKVIAPAKVIVNKKPQ